VAAAARRLEMGLMKAVEAVLNHHFRDEKTLPRRCDPTTGQINLAGQSQELKLIRTKNN